MPAAGFNPPQGTFPHAGASRGEHAQAAETYAEAAERWRAVGNVPERAYALLGQGRCLAAIGKPVAEKRLREARELFATMGTNPLAETEALLCGTEAAAS